MVSTPNLHIPTTFQHLQAPPESVSRFKTPHLPYYPPHPNPHSPALPPPLREVEVGVGTKEQQTKFIFME